MYVENRMWTRTLTLRVPVMTLPRPRCRPPRDPPDAPSLSGVFLRVPKNGEHRGRGDSGVEFQILDVHDKRYRDLKAFQYAGSVYAIAAASPHVGRPAGLWNTLEINCRDTFYEVVHNGISVLEADSAGFPQLGDRRLMGFLGLQNHSEPVRFRNLRIGGGR